MARSIVTILYERAIARRREYHVFTAPPDTTADHRDTDIQVFDADHPPDARIVAAYRAAGGGHGTPMMMQRLRARQAMLLLMARGSEIIAYGWLQDMKCQRREFWWLAREGCCMGPYWTHPNFRGQGLYGKLLSESIWLARQRGWRDLFIWAQAGNTASIRGIQKSGFRDLGVHRVHTYLGGLIRRHWQVTGPG